VATTPDGGFVVVWSGRGVSDGNIGVFARRFNASGDAISEEVLVNTTTAGYQMLPDISAGSDGRFVVTWAGEGPGDISGIFYQRFDPAGNPVGAETLVNTTVNGNQTLPSVAVDVSNDFVIAWSGYGAGDSAGIFLQRFDAEGNLIDGEHLVNTQTASTQEDACLSSYPNGSLVVTWASYAQDGSEWGIFAQKYDDNGQRDGTEFQVNQTTPGSQRYPSVATLGSLGFTVAWSGSGDGDTSGVFARRILDGPAMPILAAGEPTSSAAAKSSLTANQLNPIVESTIHHLETSELNSQQLDALGNVRVRIADLPRARLGQTTGQTITVDTDAAGHGWFVDVTPLVSEEFSWIDGNLLADPDTDAHERMDLLSVLMHELGHVLRQPDVNDWDDENDLMYGWLAAGVRRTLTADELAAVFAEDDWLE
jgi:hypothetical protein